MTTPETKDDEGTIPVYFSHVFHDRCCETSFCRPESCRSVWQMCVYGRHCVHSHVLKSLCLCVRSWFSEDYFPSHEKGLYQAATHSPRRSQALVRSHQWTWLREIIGGTKCWTRRQREGWQMWSWALHIQRNLKKHCKRLRSKGGTKSCAKSSATCCRCCTKTTWLLIQHTF